VVRKTGQFLTTPIVRRLDTHYEIQCGARKRVMIMQCGVGTAKVRKWGFVRVSGDSVRIFRIGLCRICSVQRDVSKSALRRVFLGLVRCGIMSFFGGCWACVWMLSASEGACLRYVQAMCG